MEAACRQQGDDLTLLASTQALKNGFLFSQILLNVVCVRLQSALFVSQSVLKLSSQLDPLGDVQTQQEASGIEVQMLYDIKTDPKETVIRNHRPWK